MIFGFFDKMNVFVVFRMTLNLCQMCIRDRAYYALPTEAEMILHCFRLPEKGEDFKLYSAVCLFNILLKRYPAAMRGITINKMGRIMNSLGAERMHTTTGNMYKLVALAG